MKAKKDYKGRIILDPQVHFGKPCISGTRIPVEDVLELVQEGISFKEIRENYYPDLAFEAPTSEACPPSSLWFVI